MRLWHKIIFLICCFSAVVAFSQPQVAQPATPSSENNAISTQTDNTVATPLPSELSAATQALAAAKNSNQLLEAQVAALTKQNAQLQASLTTLTQNIKAMQAVPQCSTIFSYIDAISKDIYAWWWVILLVALAIIICLCLPSKKGSMPRKAKNMSMAEAKPVEKLRNVDLSANANKAAVTNALSDTHLESLTADDMTATKLDLARAYIDMDDIKSAEILLNEVVQQGTLQQQAEAKLLLTECKNKP